MRIKNYKYWIRKQVGKDREGSGRGLILSTAPEFA
jgi:hypothetical protein